MCHPFVGFRRMATHIVSPGTTARLADRSSTSTGRSSVALTIDGACAPALAATRPSKPRHLEITLTLQLSRVVHAVAITDRRAAGNDRRAGISADERRLLTVSQHPAHGCFPPWDLTSTTSTKGMSGEISVRQFRGEGVRWCDVPTQRQTKSTPSSRISCLANSKLIPLVCPRYFYNQRDERGDFSSSASRGRISIV